ncbi:penicillin-binding protein activator [Halioxenophilus aromaticivorans]|uniref:Penicillin-binding protein activator n=1 Tax=Halioxenophilus aromaticivorans TaxID=1306992 RepID=A0AAV3TYC3_9ALTE
MKLLKSPLYRGLGLATTFTLLVSCGSQMTQTGNSAPTVLDNTLESAEILLTDAATSAHQGDPAKAAATRLEAGHILVNIGELTTAERVLSDVQSEHLQPEQRVDYALTYSDLALSLGEYYIAKRVLDDPAVAAAQDVMTTDQKYHWRINRAGTYTLIGEPVLAIREHLSMTPYLDENQKQANNDQIWQLLLSLPSEALDALAQREPNNILRGWFALASLSKNNQANLEQQLKQVSQWQLQWSNHPAAVYPPQDLQLLEQLVNNQPQQIAVLLPLTGKLANAGKAIREGIMAAYYSAEASGQKTPVIRVYNTDQGEIQALYDQAILDGAETVIGPLQKELLQSLNERRYLPVPTLALNYLLEQTQQTENLFQFGLAPEDEAKQVAELAWRDGHRHAMVLSSNRDWGQRSAGAFIEAWKALGGDVTVYSEFSLQRDFSAVVERTLLVDRSKQRGRNIENLMGIDMVTQPRSRDDIDVIFMVAQPEDARQLKPTLAFHYAGDIPVYATSHLFNPDADRSANSDLNGIRFPSIPWNFGFSKIEHDELAELLPNLRSLQNLQAMGVDAYRLYPRLLQLQQVAQARYYGATGELYLTPEGRIARHQAIAEMRSGRATLLPTAGDDLVSN